MKKGTRRALTVRAKRAAQITESVTDNSPVPSDVQALAAENRKLFPLGSIGDARKRPAITAWPALASSNLTQLHAWAEQFPGCNWALQTGEESGIFALDVDGEQGQAWLAAQLALYGSAWTQTRAVQTAAGKHFYFMWPAVQIRNSVGKIAPGIDVRGTHGYTVVPPSLHPSGAPYRWASTATQPIIGAPQWLIDAALSAARNDAGADSSSSITEGIIPEGRRNAELMRVAGMMRRVGLNADQIDNALQLINSEACAPVLAADEVRRVAESAAGYALLEPDPIAFVSRREPGTLHFESLAEVRQLRPADTPFLIPALIPQAVLVELVGKIKASGKTTFALAMARAVADGREFLGSERCAQSPVLLLSEMPPASLVPALDQAGLIDQPNFALLRWHSVRNLDWLTVVQQTWRKADTMHAKLVILDTLGQFSALEGDAENDSGTANAVLRPLQAMQEHGITVLLVRHEGKGEKELSDAARGSSAYSGAADVLIRLSRLGASHPVNFRKVETLSRFAEISPQFLVELNADGYRLHADSPATLEATRQAVLVHLPSAREHAISVWELQQATKQSESSVKRAVQDLLDADIAQRTGEGKKGAPFRYFAPATLSAEERKIQ